MALKEPPFKTDTFLKRKKRILVFPCGSEVGLELHRSLSCSTHLELYGASSAADHGEFVYRNYVGGLPYVDEAGFIDRRSPVLDAIPIPECPDGFVPQLARQNIPLERIIFQGPMMDFYQRFLGSSWGRRCAYYPSCSNYFLLAIRKHGAVVGAIMALDRLQHEANEGRYSPLILTGGEIKVYDPLENNDYWWYRMLAKEAAPVSAARENNP